MWNTGVSEDRCRAQNYATRYLKIGFDDLNFHCKIYNLVSTGLPFNCSFTNPNIVVQDVIFYYFLLLHKKEAIKKLTWRSEFLTVVLLYFKIFWDVNQSTRRNTSKNSNLENNTLTQSSVCAGYQQNFCDFRGHEYSYCGEIIPTRCNNCVYSSQWLYSTCFGWQFHPSSGVQCCIWPFR